jgi:chemotaxis protein CheD
MIAPEGGGVMAEPAFARIYLLPGQVYASAEPTRITTILGSCVAICLFDETRGIGGMNHFMLPHFAGTGVKSARFGNVAMDELLAQLQRAGARTPFLKARLFGGSCMFEPMRTAAGHLGEKNAAMAAEMLAARNIPVVESHTGGTRGRKLAFHTHEGLAWQTLI